MSESARLVFLTSERSPTPSLTGPNRRAPSQIFLVCPAIHARHIVPLQELRRNRRQLAAQRVPEMESRAKGVHSPCCSTPLHLPDIERSSPLRKTHGWTS